MFATTSVASAQETIVVEENSESIADYSNCKTQYYVNAKDNWFIQVGAGIDVPLMENYLTNGGDAKRHITAAYNLGFGKWFSPYIGFRISGYYGSAHWNAGNFSKMRYGTVNADLMWDMCNSLGGVNPARPVSVVPFVGIGGTYSYKMRSAGLNVIGRNGELKTKSWSLPVSAGIQLRFRLCKYADFYVESRASFYGDNFNNTAMGRPIDINIQTTGGFIFNIGGVNYQAYSPCKDQAYIASLNNDINNLRGELAATAAALAAAQAQLPCPEVQEQVQETQVIAAPLMSTVRFTINSSKISKEEMVNVYNTAEYLKANPEINVLIKGYADKDTGTSSYNMALSQRRAQSVFDALTKTYGISPDRLAIEALGSDTQVYDTNNWNRIVIFVPGF